MLSKKIIWKLNVIDLLIILIIIFSISALIYKATWGTGDAEYRDYKISFVCENVPISLVEDMETGLKCADGDSGTELGDLIELDYVPVITQPALSQTTTDTEKNNNDSDTDKSSLPPLPTLEPTRAKATFTTQVEGISAEHGIKINKSVYLKGKTVNLIIGDSIFTVYVNNIE